MSFTNNNSVKFVLLMVALLSMSVAVMAQGGDRDARDAMDPSTLLIPELGYMDLPVATGNNLYCAGFIQKASVSTGVEIVGAEDEKDQHIFAEGDALYINSGSRNGVQVGDKFAVIRPRGRVNSEWTSKGYLGYFVQELGAVEVIRVMSDVSVAKVTTSCDVMLLGDLLEAVPERTSPMFEKRPDLDMFASPSGKAIGSIVMARDGAEIVARDHIVYIDLGAEDNVSVGDFLTVFRPLGTGNVYTKVPEESVDNREDGYESRRYRGGSFSNQSARKKGSEAKGAVVTSENAKSRRPSGLRRIVGELMIINVKESTATAVVVRNGSEIHTGDRVEVQ